ncbi:hypothetical protein HK096_009871, partial [Nowakowskiella sp. JEL0078]
MADDDAMMDPDSNLFEGLKKKKKKKKVVVAEQVEQVEPVPEPVVEQPVQAANVPAVDSLSASVAELSVEDTSVTAAAPAEILDEETAAMFENLKKKKKPKKKEFIDPEEGVEGGAAAVEQIEEFLGEKKKKKKKTVSDFENLLKEGDDTPSVNFGNENETQTGSQPSEPWLNSDREYTYEE